MVCFHVQVGSLIALLAESGENWQSVQSSQVSQKSTEVAKSAQLNFNMPSSQLEGIISKPSK